MTFWLTPLPLCHTVMTPPPIKSVTYYLNGLLYKYVSIQRVLAAVEDI